VVGADAESAQQSGQEGQQLLHFELEAVLTAVDGCTILYRNHRGQLVAESLYWNEAGLVTRAAVAYGPTAG